MQLGNYDEWRRQETLCHHPVGKSLISSSIESQSKSFFGKSVQWGRVLWCLWNVFRLRQVWLPSFSSKRRQDEKMKVLFTKKEKLPDSDSNPSLNDQMALCTYESGSSGWDSFMSIDWESDWRLKTGVKSTLFLAQVHLKLFSIQMHLKWVLFVQQEFLSHMASNSWNPNQGHWDFKPVFLCRFASSGSKINPYIQRSDVTCDISSVSQTVLLLT